MAGRAPSPATGLWVQRGGGRHRAADGRMLRSRDSSRHPGPGGQGGRGGAGPPRSWCGGSRPPAPHPGVLMPHGTSCAIEQGGFAGAQPARRRCTRCTPCPGYEQLHPIHSGLTAPRAHGTLCRRWRRWPPAAARVRRGEGRGCRGQVLLAPRTGMCLWAAFAPPTSARFNGALCSDTAPQHCRSTRIGAEGQPGGGWVCGEGADSGSTREPRKSRQEGQACWG